MLDDVVERSLKSAALWDEVKERLDASALDPIATSKIEALICSPRSEYTVLIVTHDMPQAARVSDYSAFMYLGNLLEVAPTNIMFLEPARRKSEEYVTGRIG